MHNKLLAIGLVVSILLLCSQSIRVAAELGRAAKHGDLPLGSVGKLRVPAQRYKNGYAQHFNESCSATLISVSSQVMASSLIVSAWHCLEDYRDTSRPLLFETATGKTVEATLLADGGGMHSDWALLRLAEPLPFPAVLGTLGYTRDDPLLMAGYPRSTTPSLSSGPPPLAANTLQTASDCSVTGSVGRDTQSNCVIQKGASGGAVFSDTPEYRYLGVISRGDGESLSIFVPATRFRAQINGFLDNLHLP